MGVNNFHQCFLERETELSGIASKHFYVWIGPHCFNTATQYLVSRWHHPLLGIDTRNGISILSFQLHISTELEMTEETPEVRSSKSLTLLSLTNSAIDQWTDGPIDMYDIHNFSIWQNLFLRVCDKYEVWFEDQWTLPCRVQNADVVSGPKTKNVCCELEERQVGWTSFVKIMWNSFF